jgi:hypothetical protein
LVGPAVHCGGNGLCSFQRKRQLLYLVLGLGVTRSHMGQFVADGAASSSSLSTRRRTSEPMTMLPRVSVNTENSSVDWIRNLGAGGGVSTVASSLPAMSSRYFSIGADVMKIMSRPR